MPTCLQTLASYYLSGSKTFCNTNQKLRVFTLKVKFVLTFFKRRNVYFEDKWCPFPVCVSVFTAQRIAGKCLQTRRRVPCELHLLANSAITRTYLQRNFFPCDWGFQNNWNGDCRQPPATAYQPVGECLFFLHWLPDSHYVTRALVTWDYQYGGQVNMTWFAVMWLQNPQ